MNKELLEEGVDMQDTRKENNYQRYLKLGGIINKDDYESALSRLEMAEKNQEIPDKNRVTQAGNMAKFAGIELGGQNGTDQRVRLYSILRSDVKLEKVKPKQTNDQRTSIYYDGVSNSDTKTKEVERHHSEMNDQRIFVEALRMLGDVDSVDKMIKAYPNISFKY
ncbi:MAG: hypothetical protein A3C61_00715 [Candidatus Yanofskybacteria bacterium RIFCSPHIGHO2_02_FULL_39_10]|uniref:Uncharacterized protein n=1 Tax=Candidatus Yanofskybacteria bacterium RIFCSPHIGHO2_02_FULL_39_10 TaxID=1802674 RepID=A0A1F8F897_9BACT|nr:MAG: hypothetical protein A3C61_00715 [Candidatus Yanofskybacteria bacterium RIFCSPHIGHO2_02_FULL_39_10]